MIKAPQIDRYIHILRDHDTYADQATREVISRVFDEIHKIASCGDDERREIWIQADRGSIEDYGDYQEYLEDESVSNYEEFEEMWLEEYPEKQYWYHLVTIEQNNFLAIFLGRELIYQSEINSIQPGYHYEEDLTELFSWIELALKESVQMVFNGTYNDYVEKNLPAKHRTGIISRKDFWNIFPEYKENYFSEISKEEVDLFLKSVSEQTDDAPVGRYLKQMTAADFYRFCSLGYKANDYERIKNVSSPKEQYRRIADGRDDGLAEIDENDPNAFADWLDNRKWHGGHPWEVCAGGNSTHIDLYVSHDSNGYYLALRGESYGRSIETVKFYNAIRKEGTAVYLFDAKGIAARITAEDQIGIVPYGFYPFYCESWFPVKGILDFINLPYDPYEKEEVGTMLPFITWFPEIKVKPVSNS